MLSFDNLQKLRLALLSSLEQSSEEETKQAKEAFRHLTAPDQLAHMIGVLPKMDERVLKAFVVTFRANSGLVEEGSEEHRELYQNFVGPAPTGWHKPNPPTDLMRVMIPGGNTPAWTEELCATAEIALKTAHPVATNPEFLCMEIKNHFGIGGLEDIGLEWGIQPHDETMKILMAAVIQNLIISRPEWFSSDGDILLELPDGVDSRSASAIQEALEQEVAARRAAEKLEARRQKREDAAATYAEGLRLLGARMSADEKWSVILSTSAGAGFQEAKDLVGTWEVPEKLIAHAISTLQADTIARAAGALPMPTADTPNEGVEWDATTTGVMGDFLRQAFMLELSNMQPTWFIPRANGGVRFRRVLVAVEPKENKREQETIIRHIRADIVKYGKDKVLQAISEILAENVAEERAESATNEQEERAD